MLTTSESDSDSEYVLPAKRRRKITKPRINFENLTDPEFMEKFRFDKAGIESILIRIGGQLAYDSQRNNPLTPQQQLLFTLRWYASNAAYNVIADAHGPHKSTLCRTIRRVTQAINSTPASFMRFTIIQYGIILFSQ